MHLLFPSRIRWALDALHLGLVVDRRGDGAGFAGFAGAVPDGLLRRADAVGWVDGLRLAFMSSSVVNLSAVTWRIARVGADVVGEVVWTGFAGLFAKIKVEPVGTLEAVVGDGVDVWVGDRAARLVVLDAVREDLILVLLLRDVAIDPVLCLQVVLVLALAQVNEV